MGEWIRAAERLPLEADPDITFEVLPVLVSDEYGAVFMMDFTRGGGHVGMPWTAWSDCGPLNAKEITHWMPLPEPPK